MRKRVRGIIGTLILLGAMFTSFAALPEVKADMPVTIGMYEGGIYQNGTHITIPLSQIRVNITKNESVICTNMETELQLTTNVTQKMTIGMVEPIYFAESYTDLFDGNWERNFTMLVNNTAKEFRNGWLNRTELNESYPKGFWNEYGWWLLNGKYNQLDLELQANSTTNVTIISTTGAKILANGIEYLYVVANPLNLSGDTHKILQMHVKEVTPFLSFQFAPNDSLDVKNEGINTDVVWDFNVSEFDSDIITLNGEVNEFQPRNDINPLWLLFFGGMVAIILTPVVVKIVYWRRQLA